MRSELLTAITTAISTLTQFAVSQELPWEQNGQSLFRKNMKKIYVDRTTQVESTLIPTLDHSNIHTDELTTQAFVSVDAKNPPSQLDSLISAVLACRDRTGIVNITADSDYTLDKTEDVLTVNFEFRLNTLKT